MSTVTPDLRAEIAQHLRASSDIRLGMVLRDIEEGLDVEQIASSQGIPLNGARGYVRILEEVLSGKVPTTPSEALKRARTYRYLQGCDLSPALRSYVTSCLGQLAAINPEVSVEKPFRPGTLRDAGTHPARGRKVWIFQANPKRYDLLDFLARPSTQPGIVDDWTLRQHAKDVSDADTVLLWTAGDQAGIYATGTVVGESFMRPRQDWEPENAPPESPTIHYRLDRILDHPVLRRDLVNHPVLKDLSVIRQPQGTNFPVTVQQWEALRPLIEPLSGSEPRRNPDTAYFILNQSATGDRGEQQYDDIEGRQYHWKNSSSRKGRRLSESPGARFIYYRTRTAPDGTSQTYFGHGRVGEIVEEPVGNFVAPIAEYVRFKRPVPSAEGPDINHQTSMQTISKEEFDRLVRLGSAEVAHGELTLDLIRDAAAKANLKLDGGIYSQLLAALASGKHVILTGPPGTAKTTLSQVVAKAAKEAGACSGFLPTTATSDWTTFETIGGFRPKGPNRLEFEEGHFLKAIRDNQWLLIDELNRSQFDRAFGQLFTVLSGQPVVLPYSRPEMDDKPLVLLPHGADSPIDNGDVLPIPSGWRIIATMNVFDKSLLFEMSFALMRRFAFIEVTSPSDAVFGLLIDQAAEDEARAAELAKRLLDVRRIKDLGPAIYQDLTRFFRKLITLRDAEDGQVLFEGFYSYLLPQFEGIDEDDGKKLYKTIAQMMGSDDLKDRLRKTLKAVLGLELLVASEREESDGDEDDLGDNNFNIDS